MLANTAYKYRDAHVSCSSAMLLCTTYIHHELIGTHVYIRSKCSVALVVESLMLSEAYYVHSFRTCHYVDYISSYAEYTVNNNCRGHDQALKATVLFAENPAVSIHSSDGLEAASRTI